MMLFFMNFKQIDISLHHHLNSVMQNQMQYVRPFLLDKVTDPWWNENSKRRGTEKIIWPNVIAFGKFSVVFRV